MEKLHDAGKNYTPNTLGIRMDSNCHQLNLIKSTSPVGM